MPDLNEFINQAVAAARREGFLDSASQVDVDKEADTDAGESGPDPIVEEHLREEAAKEASEEIERLTKLGLYAVLTAGDSVLAVERCRRERESS